MTSPMVDGDPNAPIMIVGEGPGREEIEQGRPFCGPSGGFLWAVAKECGFTRADCYIVNVTDSLPLKKNRPPTAAQIAACHPEFDRHIAAFRGRIVVPLGGVALTAITGLPEGIESWRGYLVSLDECLPTMVSELVETTYKTNRKGHHKIGDRRIQTVRTARKAPLAESVQWIIPTLHPSGVLRSGKKTLPAFAADLERVVRAVSGKLRAPLKYEEYREEYVPVGAKAFVIDTETYPHLRVGYAGRRLGTAEAVAWTAPLSPMLRDHVRSEFRSGETLVAHNVQFDLGVLDQHGMPWTGKIWDTMLAAAMVEPDLYKGLNEVASLYFDRQRWKHLSDVDPVGYNLDDVKMEYALFEILKEDLAKDGMLRLFEDTVMPAVYVLHRMTKRGLRMHPERRKQWLADLTVEYTNHMTQWQELVGDVNPNAPAQVRSLLYDRYQLPLKFSKHNAESLTAERAALYELLTETKEGSQERKCISTLLELRRVGKLLSTYAKREVGDDGCIHPYYLPTTKDSDRQDWGGKGVAGTGRIQARNPNIQQLPPSARKIIIPHSDDLCLVSFDSKQLELRIAAVQSQDEALLETLAAEDPFAVIMEQLGCDRTRAKNVAYGTIYGGGARAIVHALRSRGYKLEEKEAKQLQQAFAARYPRLWRWRELVMAQARAALELTTPFGRKRYFYDKKDGPAAVDFMCQGTAADIMWSSLPIMDAVCEAHGGALLATIHDELLCEFPRDQLGAAISHGTAALQRPYDQIARGFWVPTEAKVGDNWGEMRKYGE